MGGLSRTRGRDGGGSSSKGPEYADDNVTRMPNMIDGALQSRARNRLTRQLQARSGRTSTRLVSNAGIAPYVASLMGSTS